MDKIPHFLMVNFASCLLMFVGLTYNKDIIILNDNYNPCPWQFLYFLPLPQGQASLRPTFCSTRIGCCFGLALGASSSLPPSLRLSTNCCLGCCTGALKRTCGAGCSAFCC